jgi:hypothetical protein
VVVPQTSNRSLRSLFVISLVALAGGAPAQAAGAPEAPPAPPPGAPPGPGGGPPGGFKLELPDHFKNLKVLPEDIKKEELLNIMKAFNKALGVRCNHCHTMQPKPDWAADTDHKKIARSMMTMTQKISHDYFTWPDAPKATCFMCHRGAEKPVFTPPPGPPGEHGEHGGPPPGAPPPGAPPPPAP